MASSACFVVTSSCQIFAAEQLQDANLKHLFTGSRTGKPGRPKLYDGKVSLHDFSRWDAIPWADACMVYTVVAYSVSLERQVRVVAVVWPGSRSSQTEVLFSTSVPMTAATIIALYRARFCMEFPFRDGKRPSVLMGRSGVLRRSSVVNRRPSVVIGAALVKNAALTKMRVRSRRQLFWPRRSLPG